MLNRCVSEPISRPVSLSRRGPQNLAALGVEHHRCLRSQLSEHPHNSSKQAVCDAPIAQNYQCPRCRMYKADRIREQSVSLPRAARVTPTPTRPYGPSPGPGGRATGCPYPSPITVAEDVSSTGWPYPPLGPQVGPEGLSLPPGVRGGAVGLG